MYIEIKNLDEVKSGSADLILDYDVDFEETAKLATGIEDSDKAVETFVRKAIKTKLQDDK